MSEGLWEVIGPLLPPEPSKPKGGKAASPRPHRPGEHSLRLKERHPLAEASGGVLLQRRDLLAATARLARDGRMAALAAGAARSARTSGPHRLVQGVGGLGQHAGQANLVILSGTHSPDYS